MKTQREKRRIESSYSHHIVLLFGRKYYPVEGVKGTKTIGLHFSELAEILIEFAKSIKVWFKIAKVGAKEEFSSRIISAALT